MRLASGIRLMRRVPTSVCPLAPAAAAAPFPGLEREEDQARKCRGEGGDRLEQCSSKWTDDTRGRSMVNLRHFCVWVKSDGLRSSELEHWRHFLIPPPPPFPVQGTGGIEADTSPSKEEAAFGM